jgi:O-antigen/teichoic acid export membrane protein
LSDTEVAKKSARGSLILFIGNFLATVFNAIAIILVARLLGPSEYGTYSLSLVAPGLLMLFFGLGMNPAITRYSAHYLSIGQPDKAKRFTRSAILYFFLFGLALSTLNYVLAGVLSSSLLFRPDLARYLQVASLTILGSTLLTSVTSISTGWNMMSLASASTVLQSVVKLIAAPALVLAGFGVLGAIDGHVLSNLVAGFVGIALIYALRLRSLPYKPWNFIRELVEMIKFGFPAFLGYVITGLASYCVTILLAAIASNAVFGLYQAASNFAVPVSLLSASIGNALFPAFASLAGTGGDVRGAFDLSLRYVSYLIAPVALFLVGSASVFVPVLLGASYSHASVYLQLLALSYLPVAVGSGVLPVYFNGLGKTRLTMYINLASSAFLVGAAPALALGLGLEVDGLIYAIFVSNIAALGLGLFLARRRLSASANLRPILMILVSSTIAAAVIAAIPDFLPGVPMLVLQLVVFLVVYLTLAPLLGAVNEGDVGRLELVLTGIAVVGTLSRWLLAYERFVIERLGIARSPAPA